MGNPEIITCKTFNCKSRLDVSLYINKWGEPFGLPQGRREESYYYPLCKYLLKKLSLTKEAPKKEIPKEKISRFPKQDQLDSLRRAKETLEKIHTSLPADARA